MCIFFKKKNHGKMSCLEKYFRRLAHTKNQQRQATIEDFRQRPKKHVTYGNFEQSLMADSYDL
jgi:hypothetical protein